MYLIKNYNRAFTLVELIVVITILVILGTIAFLSFQGYAKSSRDSVRVSDLASISQAYEYYFLDTSVYPNPSDSENITYSGATVWYQGTVGKSVVDTTQKLSHLPVDPLTQSQYTYSLLFNKKEFELGSIMESSNYVAHQLMNAYAANNQTEAYTKGNYNGVSATAFTGNTTYVLAIPSIITSDITSNDVIEILNNKKLVYKGYKNLPSSYKNSQFDTQGGFDFSPDFPLVFQGDSDDLYESDYARLQYAKALKKAYSGSLITLDSGIGFLSSSSQQVIEPEELISIEHLVQTVLKKDTVVKKADISPTTCGENDATFEGYDNNTNVNDSCLFSVTGDNLLWEVTDGVGVDGGKALYAANNAVSLTNTIHYNVYFKKPAKLEFDYKFRLSPWSYLELYINGIKYKKWSGQNLTEYQHYQGPLLPAGEYLIEWKAHGSSGGWRDYFWLDNISFSCINGGLNCGYDNDFEPISGSKLGDYEYEITTNGTTSQLPWMLTSDASQSTTAIETPDVYSGNAKLTYKTTQSQPFKLAFDYKNKVSRYGYLHLFINGAEYKKWTNDYTTGYESYETPLLPAGNYTFEWKTKLAGSHYDKVKLDNIHFTCVGGGIGCSTNLAFEPIDGNDFSGLTFTGNVGTAGQSTVPMNFPWKLTTDSVSGLALETPDAYYGNVYVAYTHTSTAPFKITFDYKVKAGPWTDYNFYIDNVSKLHHRNINHLTYEHFESEVLPAGTYEFKWYSELSTSWYDKAKLDNIEFIVQ